MRLTALLLSLATSLGTGLGVAAHAQAKPLTVMVHPFENNGDPTFSWVSAGLTDAVIADLGKVKDVEVVTEMTRRKAIEEMALTQTLGLDDAKTAEVGSMVGADLVFSGSFMVLGSRIRLFAKLVSVEGAKVLETVKLDGTIDSLFALQDEIVIALLTESSRVELPNVIALKVSNAEREEITADVPPPAEAFELFARGLELKYSDPNAAMESFRGALAIHPDYPAALVEAGVTAGRELNRFDEAFRLLGRAEALYSKLGDRESKGYADLLQLTGSVYLSLGKTDTALEYLNRAMKHREKLGLQMTAAYADLLLEVGWAHFTQKRLDDALAYYGRCKQTKDALGLQRTSTYPRVLNVMGSVYYRKGDLNRALDYYLQAKRIRDGLGLNRSADYSALASNISLIYTAQKQYERALEHLELARRLREELGLRDTIGYGFALYNLAAVYERQGKRDLAGEHYRRAHDLWEKLGYQEREKGAALEKARQLGH